MEKCLNIPGPNSPGSYWTEWHQEAKKCVGKSRANSLYSQLVQNLETRLTSLSGPYSPAAMQYAKAQNISIDQGYKTGFGLASFAGLQLDIFSKAQKWIIPIAILLGLWYLWPFISPLITNRQMAKNALK